MAGRQSNGRRRTGHGWEPGRYTLLLLSGKDRDDDASAVGGLASSLPRMERHMFEAVLREIAAGPRPLLVNLTELDPGQVDDAVTVASEALAVAFFRRLGVF